MIVNLSAPAGGSVNDGIGKSVVAYLTCQWMRLH